MGAIKNLYFIRVYDITYKIYEYKEKIILYIYNITTGKEKGKEKTERKKTRKGKSKIGNERIV